MLLEEQDRATWNAERIAEGLRVLRRAAALRRPGPYQLQAAIAEAHAEAARPEDTDWRRIATLYERLGRLAPSPVVELNRAVAVAMVDGPEAGLELLAALDLPGYHLLHAARADLLRRLERREEAAAEYRAALGLAMNETDRRFLERRLAEIGG